MSSSTIEYIKFAKDHGFILTRTKRHLVFRHSNGKIVVCPSTPSDTKHGIKNFKKHVKKALAI